MLDTLCDQNVFYQRCVLFNDSAVGKITGRSRFTWFIFGYFRNNVAWIFTPFFKLTYNFCYNVIWHGKYVILFSLTWFGIHDLWPLLSCVGGYQTVPSLSHHVTCMDSLQWWYNQAAVVVHPSSATAYVTKMSEKCKSMSPIAIQVKNRWRTISIEGKLDIIRWL
jgi:hypothetical protein